MGKSGKPDMMKESLVFTYLYPRLDANVSTGINHLLKSPWCVHPKTGKICVPIDSTRPDDFKVSQVPTLTQVINELGGCLSMKEDGESITPPCIEPYMATFRTFLKKCEDKRIKELQKDNKSK
jgi:DNA primase small subunit